MWSQSSVNGNSSGGLGDILSLALEQTGVGSIPTPTISLDDPSSFLTAAADTIDESLLSSDLNVLTEGLFSSLETVKGSNASGGSRPNLQKFSGGPFNPDNMGGVPIHVPLTLPSDLADLNPHDFGAVSMHCDSKGTAPLPDMASSRGRNPESDARLDFLQDFLSEGNGGIVPTVLPSDSFSADNSIPSAGNLVPLQDLEQRVPPPTLPPTPADSPSIDDELSNLLNSTGTEYLESIAQELNSSTSPLQHPHLPIPTSSFTSGQLLSPITSFNPPPNVAPIISGSSYPTPINSALKFDMNAVLDQLSQPSSPAPSCRYATPSGMISTTVPGGRQLVPVRGTPMVAKPVLRDAATVAATVAWTRRGSITATEVKQSLDEDSDDEEDQLSAADTYANYRPAKLKLGHMHPDPVVESSSLSSVEPPQVWFDLKLPPHVIEEAMLSSLQLEAVVYASQQHMNILTDGSRAGFLIGDGAGVGKGRTIAGIIYQNYLEGRKKALWLSVSNDLKYDAIRDLRDVGAKKIGVYSLSKFHYGKISGKRNGRVRKGVIFATYSSLIGESSSGGKYRTRFNQLLHWLGSHFEGVIVFDECHKAKNLVPTGSSKPSKTGLTVLQLQKKLPKARIVYCSATGASEPRNMAYMSRLGIWGSGTQFPTFQDFIKSVERRGVGAMEIVAMDMKLRGMYIARQLSFSGVTFSVTEVALSGNFIEMYDASVDLWVEARKLFQEAADLMDYERKKLKTMWGQFWAAHQRFFKYLCIAAKVPETIKLAKKALEEDKCVVIGLQSTGEARTLEQLEQNDGQLSGFISTAKGVLETLIRRHFPTPSSGIDWNLFASDPTLPENCRKRKRGGRRDLLFEEETFSSSESDDSSSGGPEDSDSAVESSSDEGEGESGAETSSSSTGETSEEEGEGGNPFGFTEPWLKKEKPPKVKKRKTSPSSHRKNFSIKPPLLTRKKGTKTKTGFNSKSLKFEPVRSPKEVVKRNSSVLDRRQSIAVAERLSNPGPNSPILSRKPSLQVSMSSVGEGSLLDIMSTSAMATGSQSSLRNVTVRKMKEELLRKLEILSPHLPTNTLDELIDGLGGPRRVAEMTGRRGRVVSLADGSVQYQLRSETDVSLELLNIAEKQRFMDGKKRIAIISEAASSGISLQSDRRVKNHKRRVHITLELPWSADKAIQQFGRTHRSNQVNAPEYVFLISELSGEQRFASIVAKRLQSLGALTHGDRRATESRDLSKYNVDTKYGRSALETVLKSVVGMEPPILKTEEYNQDFFDKSCVALSGVDLIVKDDRGLLVVDKEAANMSRFLNRILGLPVRLQNQLFAYFTDTLAAIIRHAKRTGKWDGGILDYGASGEQVDLVEMKEFVGDPAFGTATTQLHKIHVERGLSFSEALEKLNADCTPGEGFYVCRRVRNDKQVAVLLKASEPGSKQFMVYRPNTGLQSRSEKLSILQKKYYKVEVEEAEKWWKMQYESSLTVCNHAFWQGRCKLTLVGHPCEVGLRRTTYHILAGSVLGVWTQLEGVFLRHGGHNSRMQIARVRMPTKRLVGILIPTACVEDLKQTLTRIALQAAGTSENPMEV